MLFEFLFAAPVEPPLLETLTEDISCTDATVVSHPHHPEAYSTTDRHFDALGRPLATVTRRADGAEVHTLFRHTDRSRTWLEVRYDESGATWLSTSHTWLDAAGRPVFATYASPGRTSVRAWTHVGDTSVLVEAGASPGSVTTLRGPHGPMHRIVRDASGVVLAETSFTYDALGKRVEQRAPRAVVAPYWSTEVSDRCAPTVRDTATVVVR